MLLNYDALKSELEMRGAHVVGAPIVWKRTLVDFAQCVCAESVLHVRNSETCAHHKMQLSVCISYYFKRLYKVML